MMVSPRACMAAATPLLYPAGAGWLHTRGTEAPPSLLLLENGESVYFVIGASRGSLIYLHPGLVSERLACLVGGLGAP